MLNQEPNKIQAERDILCLKLEMVSVSFTVRFLVPSFCPWLGGISLSAGKPLGPGGDLGKAQSLVSLGRVHLAPLNLRKMMVVRNIPVFLLFIREQG